MQKVDIADLKIEIIHSKLLNLDKFSPYLYSGEDVVDLTVKVEGSKSILRPNGTLVLDELIKWVKNEDEKMKHSVYICKEEPDKIAYLLNTNGEWSSASIEYLEEGFDAESAVTGPLAEILFRNRLLFSSGLVLHASAIEYKGKGILFSAPSETGKTTQAKLWCENMGATLINNDRPAVKALRNEVYVYGTPWSGTPSECNNNRAKLNAIIMLEQASENSIHKLSIKEAVSRLIPRCFLPYHDEKLMDIAINNLEVILKNTEVYLLKCRPDIGAVELVLKTVLEE